MSTNTYECSACKRTTEILENKYGLDIVARCIITHGCRGKLRKIKRNPDNIRESFPEFDSRFDNYVRRRLFFSHKQLNSSNEWTITHDLGVFPSVSVFETLTNTLTAVPMEVELPSSEYTVTAVNHNTIKIKFERSVLGSAQCVARSSVEIKPQLVDPDVATFQITVGGTFVFAFPKLITRSTTQTVPMDINDFISDIQLEIGLQKPNEEEILCTEYIPNEANTTPWVGWTEVLLRKRRNYYVETKNILDFRTLSDSDLTFDDIPEGTRLRFLRVNYGDGVLRPIDGEGVLLLLSKSPYESADKVRNRVLDLGDMRLASDGYFIYKNGEFMVDEKFIEMTYPPIEKAKTNPAPTPAPSPSVTPTLTPTPTPTVSVTVTPTPTITESNTPTPSPTSTESATPTPTPSVTESVTPTPTPSVTESVTPTPTLTPTPTPTPSPVGSSYGSTVMADSPSHYWKFDELKTDSYHATVYDGRIAGEITENALFTLNAGASFANVGVSAGGINGFSGYVNGDYTYAQNRGWSIETPVNLASYTSGYTLEAWVKFDDPGSDEYYASIFGDLNSSGYGLEVWADGFGGKLETYVVGTTGFYDDVAPVWGQWYHFVVSVQADRSMKVYINGVERISTGAGTALDYTVAFIGTDANFEALDGSVDEVAIYNYPFTSSQALAHFTAGDLEV